jgi:hypothetical protein
MRLLYFPVLCIFSGIIFSCNSQDRTVITGSADSLSVIQDTSRSAGITDPCDDSAFFFQASRYYSGTIQREGKNVQAEFVLKRKGDCLCGNLKTAGSEYLLKGKMAGGMDFELTVMNNSDTRKGLINGTAGENFKSLSGTFQEVSGKALSSFQVDDTIKTCSSYQIITKTLSYKDKSFICDYFQLNGKDTGIFTAVNNSLKRKALSFINTRKSEVENQDPEEFESENRYEHLRIIPLYLTEDFISVKINTYGICCGGHGGHTNEFINYSLKRDTVLTLYDIILPDTSSENLLRSYVREDLLRFIRKNQFSELNASVPDLKNIPFYLTQEGIVFNFGPPDGATVADFIAFVPYSKMHTILRNKSLYYPE